MSPDANTLTDKYFPAANVDIERSHTTASVVTEKADDFQGKSSPKSRSHVVPIRSRSNNTYQANNKIPRSIVDE